MYIIMKRNASIIVLVVCMVWEVHGAVNCTLKGNGRFPEPTDTSCKQYTLCVHDSSVNNYRSYNYVCPSTSVFNANTSKCTAPGNYVCTVTNSSSNASSTTCTSEGFFPNPNSTNCSSYIGCVDIDGSYVETVFTCQPNSYFNPDTAYCDPNYDCAAPFNCTQAGRFLNTADSTCRSYFFCVLTGADTFVVEKYTCPSPSIFSSAIRACTTRATCSSRVAGFRDILQSWWSRIPFLHR